MLIRVCLFVCGVNIIVEEITEEILSKAYFSQTVVGPCPMMKSKHKIISKPDLIKCQIKFKNVK